MARVWDFDYNYMQSVVDRGEKLLRKNIPKEEKYQIKATVETLKLFINGIYDDEETYKMKNYSFDQIKHKTLYKMNMEYRNLGNEFIDNILKLDNLSFDLCNEKYTSFDLKSMDDMAKETLEVYKKYLPNYKKLVREIVYNPKRLIKNSSDIFTSYCIVDDYLNETFMLIDSSAEPNVFAHEVQHAVEYKLNFDTSYLFHELGPMVIEKLFIENMKQNGENGIADLFIDRIENIEDLLDYSTLYLKAIKEFSKTKFRNISDDKFLGIMQDNYLLIDDIEELQDGILNLDIYRYLTYIISYFKSIEVYNRFMDDKIVGYQSLERILNSPEYKIKITNKSVDEYQEHFNYVKKLEKTSKN